ncbi:MAG: phage/plasmid primase, P4 family [Planctomycetaceae bacterium]|nr:phage/plasmid primase, P4 family [Planctomycetaceae bacterium]
MIQAYDETTILSTTETSDIRPTSRYGVEESDRVKNVRLGHKMGWSFIPLAGKRPLMEEWPTAPRETLDQALEWASKGNVGLRTGTASGILVIDIDQDTDPLGLPTTVTAKTSRGTHHYFKAPKCKIGNSVKKLGGNIDIKSDGGQVVYPGSVHPETGKIYQWIPGLSPQDVEVSELPADIIQKILSLQEKPERKDLHENPAPLACGNEIVRKAIQEVREAEEGSRNDTLNAKAYLLGRRLESEGLNKKQVELVLIEAAIEAGLSEDEAADTTRSGLEAGIKNPAAKADEIKLTDLGNAERFANQHRNTACYCQPRNSWFIWNGKRWERDILLQVQKSAEQTILSIRKEARNVQDLTRRRAMEDFATKSESRSRVEAMVDLARSKLAVRPDQFDSDPWLLAVNNGVIDLRTGELRPSLPKDFITHLSPVEYDPAATCPQWEAFLDKIFAGEADLIAFIQRLIGYCLTGSVSEQVLPIFYGDGANGKSTLLNQLKAVMGDYAGPAPHELLTVSKFEKAPNVIADLQGLRLAIASESDSGERLSEALVKLLTGGDMLKARKLYEDFGEFEPTHKIIMMTNHKPRIQGTDEGIWRRLLLVPFNVVIPKDQQDTKLTEKLRQELPGILAWAVCGCLEWQKSGLNPPACVCEATKSFRKESNSFEQFMEERCVPNVPARDTWTSNASLRDAYMAYCQEIGENSPLNTRAIAAILKAKGCHTVSRGRYGRGWEGIALLPEDTGPPESGGPTAAADTPPTNSISDTPSDSSTN